MKRTIRRTDREAAARKRGNERAVVVMVGEKPLRISESTIARGAQHGIDIVGATKALAELHDLRKKRRESRTPRLADSCWHAPKS